MFVSVLSIEPLEAITFNKDGNDITGTITLKNITTDKSLSYKVHRFYIILLLYNHIRIDLLKQIQTYMAHNMYNNL